jgi:hypothetical protein
MLTVALAVLAEWLAPYGFDGDYLFVEANRRKLSADTPEQREGSGDRAGVVWGAGQRQGGGGRGGEGETAGQARSPQ